MINPRQLEDLLEVLRDAGATQFSCPEFAVTLAPSAPEAEDSIGDAIESAKSDAMKPRAARGLFGHPALWGSDGPPMFPGSERATPNHAPTHSDDVE